MAASPVAVMGNVPVNGVQSVPSASFTSHAQLAGGTPDGTSGAGNGLFSLSTNVEVELSTVGLILHKSVPVLFAIWKHGSLMLFPTVQRQASARNGAAMELVQQEPLSTGVELAGVAGTYAMTCVAGVAELVCEEVGFIAEGLAKNCPTPNSTTSASTTTTIILFVLFTVRNYFI